MDLTVWDFQGCDEAKHSRGSTRTKTDPLGHKKSNLGHKSLGTKAKLRTPIICLMNFIKKKSEIKKTKPVFIISVLKVEY
jgi:hypothetical protein